MNLVLLQGILALTFCLASTADVKRQLGFSDVGSYHTFFDAHPTPFIAIARADTQGPALTSVGIGKSATPPLQGIATAPLHDFNLQAVPHAVLLTPVAAKGVALDQGWHGFETAPLTFAPSFSHKTLVPVHDAPFELTPVLQNYPIQKTVPLTNFGPNHIANSFNKHLNSPPSQLSTFNGDIKQYHGFQAPSGFSGVIKHDAKPPVSQPVKSINQGVPPSGHGLISSPAPILSSPAYDSTQSLDHLGGHSSFGQESGFQGSHHFSPSAVSSSQPSYDSPTHGSKSSVLNHGRGHHHSPKHHGFSGYKQQHSALSTSYGASASGGSSSSSHTPSSTHHTAPSGLGHSSISHSTHGHGSKEYTHGYTSGHSNSGNTGSFQSSHRPSFGQGGFGSTGYGSSSTSQTDTEASVHGGTNDHGEKATSFQSFVIHSYKPVPVYSKKSEYRHFEPTSSKHHYHSPYYASSNENYDRSY